MNGTKCFRDLESSGVAQANEVNSPLREWYESIRNIPISDLSVGDLAKSLRQQLFLECTIPQAIETLSRDPLAGDMYDGELLVAMSDVRKAVWRQESGLMEALRKVVGQEIENDDIQLRHALERL